MTDPDPLLWAVFRSWCNEHEINPDALWAKRLGLREIGRELDVELRRELKLPAGIFPHVESQFTARFLRSQSRDMDYTSDVPSQNRRGRPWKRRSKITDWLDAIEKSFAWLADELDVSRRTVQAWHDGRNAIPASTAARVTELAAVAGHVLPRTAWPKVRDDSDET